MKLSAAGVLASIGLIVAGMTAQGAVTYSFQFGQSNYDVAPGSTVDVDVYLQQFGVADPTETNVLGGPDAVGMVGTGVSLTYAAETNDAQVLSEGDITGNPAFDNFGFPPYTAIGAGLALLSQSTSGAPVLGVAVAANTYDLFLGTFRFTAGSVPGQITPVTAQIPLYPNSNDNVAATFPPSVLSEISSASATITVEGNSTVPEASSMVVWGILLTGVAGLHQVRKANRPNGSVPECG